MKDMIDRIDNALDIQRGLDQQRELNRAKMFLSNKVNIVNLGVTVPEIPNYGVGKTTFSEAPYSLEWGEIYRDILIAIRDDLWDWTDIESANTIIHNISYLTKETAFITDFIDSAILTIDAFDSIGESIEKNYWDDI